MKKRNLNYVAYANAGFSLVELLVIVAIIGVLAAFAIPAFSEFRSKAYDAAAVSHMHTIMTFEDVYFADNLNYIALPSSIGTPPAGHPLAGFGAPVGVGYQLGVPGYGLAVAYVGHEQGRLLYSATRAAVDLFMFVPLNGANAATAAQSYPVNVLLTPDWGFPLK